MCTIFDAALWPYASIRFRTVSGLSILLRVSPGRGLKELP